LESPFLLCADGNLRDIVLPKLRTIGGHRRYDTFQINQRFFSDTAKIEEKRKVYAYSRVSSHDQKEDLLRQTRRLKAYCRKKFPRNYEVIEDLGSGMNYKKRGLLKLIRLILSGKVSKLILTHKDRLLRFGSELIFLICKFFNTEILVIFDQKKKTDEETLAFDVLEIITVFSARLYGKRAHQKKRLSLV